MADIHRKITVRVPGGASPEEADRLVQRAAERTIGKEVDKMIAKDLDKLTALFKF